MIVYSYILQENEVGSGNTLLDLGLLCSRQLISFYRKGRVSARYVISNTIYSFIKHIHFNSSLFLCYLISNKLTVLHRYSRCTCCLGHRWRGCWYVHSPTTH